MKKLMLLLLGVSLSCTTPVSLSQEEKSYGSIETKRYGSTNVDSSGSIESKSYGEIKTASSEFDYFPKPFGQQKSARFWQNCKCFVGVSNGGSICYSKNFTSLNRQQDYEKQKAYDYWRGSMRKLCPKLYNKLSEDASQNLRVYAELEIHLAAIEGKRQAIIDEARIERETQKMIAEKAEFDRRQLKAEKALAEVKRMIERKEEQALKDKCQCLAKKEFGQCMAGTAKTWAQSCEETKAKGGTCSCAG